MTDDESPYPLAPRRGMLQGLEIGDGVAEHDDQLARYFVETSNYTDIVQDRTDLIVGGKGTGKTALFRQLATESADIAELESVDVIPAANTDGVVVFEQARLDQMTDAQLRTGWKAFIAVLVGEHVATYYGQAHDVREILTLLRSFGIEPPLNGRSSAARPGLAQLFAATWRRLELETTWDVKVPLVPVKGSARAHLAPAETHNDAPAAPGATIDKLLRAEIAFLRRLRRRVWVLFDRLDEAFVEDRELQRRALSALMRACLDLRVEDGTVRTKVFVRRDVLDRVTRQGFVNLTHLRQMDLRWDKDRLRHLVAKRIVASAVIANHCQLHHRMLNTVAGQSRCLRVLLPRDIQEQEVFTWMERSVTDGYGELNPRNVLGLLESARRRQLEVYDRVDPVERIDPLISETALGEAHLALSETRLRDTILAEFPTLTELVEWLRDRPYRFDLDELQRVGELIAPSATTGELIRECKDSGLLQSRISSVEVAPLYRPALKSTP